MVLIVCLDIRNGMRFNKRRQSSDKAVIEQILSQYADRPIIVRPYSAKLFPDGFVELSNQEPLEPVCFLEEAACIPAHNTVDKLIVFRWDKVYPADEYFPMQTFLDNFQLTETKCFKGNSHEKITQEVYMR